MRKLLLKLKKTPENKSENDNEKENQIVGLMLIINGDENVEKILFKTCFVEVPVVVMYTTS